MGEELAGAVHEPGFAVGDAAPALDHAALGAHFAGLHGDGPQIVDADIERGEGISAALGKHPVFPAMIIRMVTAGEQTGKIENMLERISDFLDDEIETTLSGLTSLIEPLLIVFLGVTVGGIAICMFLPIFKMSEIISGPPGGR